LQVDLCIRHESLLWQRVEGSMQWFLLFLLMQDPPGIIFPQDTVPAVIVPVTPAPVAVPINVLNPDECLVIVSAKPALVIASPDGIVQIDHEMGPLKVYAKKPGSSQASWSLYDDPAFPHIYLVTAKSAGSVELIAAESLDAASLVRRRLTVSGGGPQPPPTPRPEPKPDPKPTPVPEPAPGDLRVMLLLDESDAPSASVAVRSLAVREWLDQNCVKVDGRAEYRVYDKSTVSGSGELDDENEVWRRLYAAVKNDLPEGPVAVMASGTEVVVKKFANTYDLLAALKGGVK